MVSIEHLTSGQFKTDVEKVSKERPQRKTIKPLFWLKENQVADIIFLDGEIKNGQILADYFEVTGIKYGKFFEKERVNAEIRELLLEHSSFSGDGYVPAAMYFAFTIINESMIYEYTDQITGAKNTGHGKKQILLVPADVFTDRFLPHLEAAASANNGSLRGVTMTLERLSTAKSNVGEPKSVYDGPVMRTFGVLAEAQLIDKYGSPAINTGQGGTIPENAKLMPFKISKYFPEPTVAYFEKWYGVGAKEPITNEKGDTDFSKGNKIAPPAPALPPGIEPSVLADLPSESLLDTEDDIPF